MLTPLPYQEEDIAWLGRRNRLLANDCGTGKTLTAVEAAKRFAKGPILVVCPRLTKEWWAKTIKEQGAGYVGIAGQGGRGIPYRTVANWRGDKLLWVIVHPAGVRLSVDQLSRVTWDWIIVDEAHNFKNRNAKQTKALWRLKCRHRVAMTATPYGKSPADMWALLRWLDRGSFTSYWQFYDRYVDYVQPPGRQWRKVKGAKNLKLLAAEVEPYYRKRRKEDVLPQLPPLTYSDIPIILNGEQEALYRKLEKEAYAVLGDEEVILQNALVKMLRLHQCALDPDILTEGPTRTGVPAKMEWLHEWLSDHPDEPVVITSRYRRFVEKWLREMAPHACIVGGMKRRAVEGALNEFQETGTLVGTLDAIKEGVNLQRASTIIVMDGTWSPVAEYQLSQRIHRIGQDRPCQVIHLVAKLSKGRNPWTVDKLMRIALERRLGEAEMVDLFIRQLKGRN